MTLCLQLQMQSMMVLYIDNDGIGLSDLLMVEVDGGVPKYSRQCFPQTLHVWYRVLHNNSLHYVYILQYNYVHMCIYHIAGNFQGVTFSRIWSKWIFAGFCTRLRYSHTHTSARISRLNFHGSRPIHENRENVIPQKVPTTRYVPTEKYSH